MSTEIDFPRGGTSKVLQLGLHNRKGAKRISSFSSATTKKKTKIEGDDIVPYAGVFRQKFSREILTQNLRGLAIIKFVGEVELTLECAEGILLKLPATQISRIFSKNLANTEATLDELFTMGQALAFRPLGTKERGRKSVPTVTVCPNEVNSHLIPSLLIANSVLNGAVISTEEKGAVIDLGFSTSSVNGFVHSDDLPPHLSLDKLHVGQVALFRVKEKPTPSTRVIKLSGFTEMGCLIGEEGQDVLEFKHLTPGSIVEVEPEKIVTDGLFVGINSGPKAFIRKVHLPPRLRFDSNRIAKKFRACCVACQPNTSVLMLTAHPDILALSKCEKRLLPPEFRVGSRINGCVFFVDKQRNVYFKLDDDSEKHLLTAKALRIHIDDVETNLSKFAIGSVHECRVIGFSMSERQLFVTTRSADLQQSVVCAEEALPGMKISGRISAVNANGIKVTFGRDISGYVSAIHALDTPTKHWQKRFQKGQKVSCRVLYLDHNLNKLFLTAKHSLVKQSKTEKQIVAISNDVVGIVSTGTVIKHLDGGSVLVAFYDRTIGFLPSSKVALLAASTVAIGMPLKVLVKSVDVAQGKMLLDLPSSEDNEKSSGESLQNATAPSIAPSKTVRPAKPFRVYTARVLGQWPYGGTSPSTTAELLLPGGSIGRLHASELTHSKSEWSEGTFPMQNFMARSSGKTITVKVICVSRSKSISARGRELLMERRQSDRIVECTAISEKVQEPRKKLSLIRYREQFDFGNVVPVFIVDTAKKEGTDQTHFTGEINPEFRAIIQISQSAKPAAKEDGTDTDQSDNTTQMFDTGELRFGRVIGVNKTKKGRVVCLSLVRSDEYDFNELKQNINTQKRTKESVKSAEENVEEEEEGKNNAKEESEEDEKENEERGEGNSTMEKTEEEGRDGEEAQTNGEHKPTFCFGLPDEHSLSSVEEYEKLLIAHSNSPSAWIGFVRFYLTHEGLKVCRRYELGRAVAERALKTITFQNDIELANVWHAYLNLEVALGTEESLQEVFKRACAASNSIQMHRYLIGLLKKQTNAKGREEEIRELYESMIKRFRHLELEPWFEYGRHLLQQNDADAFQNLLKRSLQCSEKKRHLTILMRFAQLEKGCGDKERAKTIDELIKNVKEGKKRTDASNME
ncbi:hypothetical protein niasHS_002705 [Heterodera schachtii]|uniref:S1 motif domain-containing protein n=1 Tax=Heterodera schachtii TaxID=97005 RepID=A0ABD2K287_HETSC